MLRQRLLHKLQLILSSGMQWMQWMHTRASFVSEGAMGQNGEKLKWEKSVPIVPPGPDLYQVPGPLKLRCNNANEILN